MADAAAGGGISNLLQNKLFLSMLSGAGEALQAGEPISAGINPVVQQSIKSQNFAKLLAQALGRDDLKMSLDTGKISLSGSPGSLLDGGTSLTPNATGGANPLSTGGTEATPVGSFGGNVLNPSSSPLGTLTASDLAGLTPQDIATVIGISQKQEELGQTGALRQAQVVKARQAPKPSSEIQAYTLAQGQGFTGSLIDFRNSATTAHQKDYQAAIQGGYEGDFNTWMIEMARAGAINLGEVIQRKVAGEQIESEAFFTDPKGLSKEFNSFISDAAQFSRIQASDNPGREKARIAEEFVEGKISAAGGVVKAKALVGRDFVWTVTWPSGRTTEVRHAN